MKLNKQYHGLLMIVFTVALFWPGCSEQGKSEDVDYVDRSITEFTNLGFLGARGHGVTKTIKLEDPDRPGKTIHPGGIVLREIDEGSPLALLGIEAGDVLIRIKEDFLPNKEDSCLDLLKGIESGLSAGRFSLPLGYLHRGAYQKKVLKVNPEEVPPLNPDALQKKPRFRLAVLNALDYLAAHQDEAGCFPTARDTADARIAVVSAAGLAFSGATDLPEGERFNGPLEKCRTYVEKAIEGERISHWGAAWATLFLAEQVNRTQNFALMMALGKAIPIITQGQQEDGGWLAAGADETVGPNEETLATGLCLQAMGAAERAGVMIENELFERTCAYLNSKTNGGDVGFLPDPLYDRRSEAGRLAGIMAGFRAISCEFSRPYMQKLFKFYGEHQEEMARAPVREAIPLWSAALVCRQKGLPEWTRFIQDHQILLLSLQKLDGSFEALPKAELRDVPFYQDCNGPAWRTALYA
ncbi:MAG: hypothetical protein KJ645_13115, partial [Planctomycetes bacterium]|nr:hypothetical protein [Planctomycetota bacterium]